MEEKERKGRGGKERRKEEKGEKGGEEGAESRRKDGLKHRSRGDECLCDNEQCSLTSVAVRQTYF